MTTKLRVVVADDSSVCRDILRDLLEAEGDIDVVGEAEDGEAAVARVASLRPDLVTLDVEMPRMDGLRAVERIMASTPVPILVVTGRAPSKHSVTLFDAIERGALDLFPKPDGTRTADADALRRMVRLLARVPVVRHVGRAARANVVVPARAAIRIVGIGASAGGPSALAALVSRLPRDFPAPIAVVQHVLTGFVDSFAEFVRAHTPLVVEVVRAPITPRAGVIYIAPDGAHLVARPDGLSPHDAPRAGGHRPAVDVLFESLAVVHGSRAAGVVLSGMGRDGASGLTAMRRAGAATFAQDEVSAAIDGMPRAARECGAAERALAPAEITEALVRATRRA